MMNCKKVMVLFACIFVMMLQITPAVGSKQLVSRNKSSKKKDSSTDEMMMLNRIPLFQQPEYKHIWDIMIRYLDAPSYHNFTVLTPAIFKYIYYPIEEYTLWMYCQFKVKAEGFTSSTIMATLSNRPFGATMFRSPCSANLCAEAKTFMFESNTLTYGKYGEHEPIMGDYQQLDKQKKVDWFPTTDGIYVFRYDYVESKLEICLKAVKHGDLWNYYSLHIKLPLVLSVIIGPEVLFFHLPTDLATFNHYQVLVHHGCCFNTYGKIIKLVVTEYFNKRCHLIILIDCQKQKTKCKVCFAPEDQLDHYPEKYLASIDSHYISFGTLLDTNSRDYRYDFV